jgi:hypothetical protein
MALEEAKAQYTLFEINLNNKPDWLTSIVNPAGEVSSSLATECGVAFK